MGCRAGNLDVEATKLMVNSVLGQCSMPLQREEEEEKEKKERKKERKETILQNMTNFPLLQSNLREQVFLEAARIFSVS